jgi:pyruvate,water dikinase
MRKLTDLFRHRHQGPAPEGPGDDLGRKLAAFQRLLEQNNAVLAAMADLEEKRNGEFLFDRAYLRNSFAALSDGVRGIIESLSELTDGRHGALLGVHADIETAIAASLRGPRIDLAGPMVLDLPGVTEANAHLAGGKMAHLGRIAAEGAVPVPPGFVITAAAFSRFFGEAGLIEQVRERLAGVPVDSLEQIERASAELRELIRGTPLPGLLDEQIRSAVTRLSQMADPADDGFADAFAVRSSAVWEDGEFSFAGQYATCLGVPAGQIASRYHDVVASLFTPRAIFYYRTKGFEEEEMAMAVGVMRMVRARAAGVLYTRDPLEPAREVMVVNGVWGLGTTVVDGAGRADEITLDRAGGGVLERRVADKPTRDVTGRGAGGGGVRREDVPADERGRPCLTDEQAAELARYAAALETRFAGPQDIEWALDAAGRLWILQSRPLQLLAPSPQSSLPRRIEGRRVLVDGGVVACKGVGAGPVAIVRTDADARAFPAGAVLVARTTATALAPVLPRAAALVTDVGSAAGHLASLAREYRVPALLDTGTATVALAPGAEVTVDAFHGTVYEGRVEELLVSAAARRAPAPATPLLQALARTLALVTPLNLVDPGAEGFRPEACRTLHDLTRYCHETAMAAMFDLAEGLGEGGDAAATLRAGIPVGIQVLDLGGGLAAHARTVTPEAVRSVPLAALLAGMRSMTWPEPRAADARGLLGMMAHTATIPEEQLRGTAEKSLALVGANYVNFSIRLGYHFSQIEAWVGEQLNDNYVRFFFKGGGAVRERRLRRVRLIGEILERLDFRVQVADDVLRALLAKERQPRLERALEEIGRAHV